MRNVRYSRRTGESIVHTGNAPAVIRRTQYGEERVCDWCGKTESEGCTGHFAYPSGENPIDKIRR